MSEAHYCVRELGEGSWLSKANEFVTELVRIMSEPHECVNELGRVM